MKNFKEYTDQENENWNPFNKKIIKKNSHPIEDPYGEEIWDDDMVGFEDKFFKLDQNGDIKDIYYRYEDDYIKIGKYVPDENGFFNYILPYYMVYYSFESGKFEKLPKNKIPNLKLLSEYEYNIFINYLASDTNDYLKIIKNKNMSNLDFLKMKFAK